MVLRELEVLKSRSQPAVVTGGYEDTYAASFFLQTATVSQRIFTEQWRDPVYIYSKVSLCVSLVSVTNVIPKYF